MNEVHVQTIAPPSAPAPRQAVDSPLARLARFCTRRRWSVIGGWVVLLIVLGGVSGAIGNAYNDSFSLPSTDSSTALNILKDKFPASSGDSEDIVFKATSGTLADQKAQITMLLAGVATVPHVTGTVSPFDPAGAMQLSKDGTIGYASVQLDAQVPPLTPADGLALADKAQSFQTPQLQVELNGQLTQSAFMKPGGGLGELIGIVAAGIILFIAFGSIWAMATPLITAVIALGCGITTVGLLSQVMNVAQFAPILTALISLGVGVDYALFIVSRHRQGLKQGMDVGDSIALALDTSGRAVMFAGTTVCIALLGMFAMGVSFLYGVALAASIGVLWTMLAAVTLLPALLGTLGLKVLSRKERRLVADRGADDEELSGGWARWGQFVQKRPAVLSAAAVVLIGIICIPALSLRLGASDASTDPAKQTTRKAYDLLSEGFGRGFNGPLSVVVETPGGSGDAAAVTKLGAALKGSTDVANVGPVSETGQYGIASKDGTAYLLLVTPTSGPQDAETTTLINRIRDDVVPQAVAGSTAVVHVGGVTAIFEDFSHVLSGRLPLFFGVVVLLSFLLLTVVFRSIVVPAVAAVMNLLSIGAAFGVVVTVFQFGYGEGLIGLSGTGPIFAFIPVIMFAILFGLSMDYEVFLVSRIHEEWEHTKDNTVAVTTGLTATGRTITAAAAIMVFVFGAFVLGGQRIIALFGVGLASAVLIDALIIRSVLVPALMQLIGKANWYLPPALDKVLPRLSIEGPAVVEKELEPVG